MAAAVLHNRDIDVALCIGEDDNDVILDDLEEGTSTDYYDRIS